MDTLIEEVIVRFERKLVSMKQLQNGNITMACFIADKERSHSSLGIFDLMEFSRFANNEGKDSIIWWGITKTNQFREDILTVLLGQLSLTKEEIHEAMSMPPSKVSSKLPAHVNQIERIVVRSLNHYGIETTTTTEKYMVIGNCISVTLRICFIKNCHCLCIPGKEFVDDIVNDAEESMRLDIKDLVLLSEPKGLGTETTLLLEAEKKLYLNNASQIACETIEDSKSWWYAYAVLFGLLGITLFKIFWL